MSGTIGMVHGYGLTGSGSNLWTRSVARALCRGGHTVHLLCQESRPEEHDWVAEAWSWSADAEPTRLFSRDTPYDGRCVVHRPDLEVLPTFVRPQSKSSYVFSMLDLEPERIEEYVERNARVMERVVREHGVPSFHVNHILLLSESLRRLKERTGTPYAVMPHGSAIEYVAKKDEGFRAMAQRALEEAGRILVLNQEIRGRLDEVFPGLTDLDARARTVRAGVDTDGFRVVPPGQRAEGYRRVAEALADAGRGREPGRSRRFLEALDDDMNEDAFRTAAAEAADHPRGHPDVDAAERLAEVDWGSDPVALYVGRLVGGKGVPSVVAAMPDVLAAHPDARLVVVGSGPLREPLEALVHALGRGRRTLAERVLEWGDGMDPDGVEAFGPSRAHLDGLRARGEADEWFRRGERLSSERVIFTGYMDHEVLRHLFPLADAAVFPSVVAEASPLVVAEAAASGCVPMGTDFAGMRRTLAAVGEGLPETVRRHMRIRPESEHVVGDIAGNLEALLARPPGTAAPLRQVAVEHFDWKRIADALVRALEEMPAGRPAPQ